MPTSGFQNIGLQFDWGVSSTKANGQLAVEYTLNGNATSPTWTDVPASALSIPSADTLTQVSSNSTNSNIINGGYFQNIGSATWQDGLSVNFSGISGANNDPNFGVRLVNAATGAAVLGRAPAVTPTAASESGSTVTITAPNTLEAGYVVGQSVTIAGITPAGFNGNYIITAIGSGTFSYTDTNTGLGTATSLSGIR